jgi:2'-5' RNA ligase
MKRRIFIAINLSEKIKKRLKEYQEKFDHLPVRWTKVSSLHITLVFIGYVDNEQMLESCKIAREVASKFDPFFINFKKIVLGPIGKEPRMIWLEGEAGKELSELKKALEEALLDGSTGFYKPEKRAFNPHITLARARAGQEEALKDAAAQIVEDFKAQFDVNSIEVMESNLKFDGAEYATLESCPVGE